MQNKARPLNLKIEILNQKDWKQTSQLDIKVSGMFRDSSWKIQEISHRIKENIIQIDIISKKLPGMALMVLTPFELVEHVDLISSIDNYKIRIIVDGDETGSLNL